MSAISLSKMGFEGQITSKRFDDLQLNDVILLLDENNFQGRGEVETMRVTEVAFEGNDDVVVNRVLTSSQSNECLVLVSNGGRAEFPVTNQDSKAKNWRD